MIDPVTYMAIPYEPNGRDYNGADCYGVVYLALRELGYDPPDYGPIQDHHIPKQINVATGEDVWEETKPEPGVVVLLRIEGRPFHVGFMMDKRAMIHMERDGCYIDEIDSPGWKNRVLGFYRCRRRLAS